MQRHAHEAVRHIRAIVDPDFDLSEPKSNASGDHEAAVNLC